MGPAGEELDLLLESARWVRALGLELAGSSEADDLAQDAWVVAMERREVVRNPAAWMSGVVRRLAGHRRRAAERRTRREREAARPEAQPGTYELVAEAELQRELIRSVTELAEPYRTAVLMRFYRGLEPEEIARRLGVPGSTVRSRLARGLAKLRERLDRTQGGRQAWAGAFVGPFLLERASTTVSSVPAGTSTLQGGTFMGVKAQAAAAIAVAVVGYGIWRGTGNLEEDSARDSEAVAATDTTTDRAEARPEPVSVAGDGEGSRREPVDSSNGSSTDTEVLLFGSVTDPQGEPVKLEWLSVEDASGTAVNVSRPSPGSYSLAGLEPGPHALRARAKGFLDLREEVVLRSGAPHLRRDLVLQPALTIPVRVVDTSGTLVSLRSEDQALDVVVTRGVPTGPLFGLVGPSHEAGELEVAGPGTVRASGMLRLRAPVPVHASLVLQDAVLATQRIDGPLPELVFTLEPGMLDAHRGGLRARFVDARTGVPLPNGRASLDLPATRSFGNQALDAEAAVEFTGRAPGFHTLRFFQPGYADANLRVRIREGAVVDLGSVPVWPATTVRGTLLDADGEPALGYVHCTRLEGLRGPEDLPSSIASNVSGGRFVLERVPCAPIRLLVQKRDRALLVYDVDATSGDVGELVLRLESGTPVSFRGIRGASERQLTLADRSGRPLATWRLGERTITQHLVPGPYQIWLGQGERIESRSELLVGDEPVLRTIEGP